MPPPGSVVWDALWTDRGRRERLLTPEARPDLVLAALLAAAAFGLTLVNYHALSPAVHHFSQWDFWFEGDPRRVFALATDRTSIHHHSTSHHPLFSLVIYPPVLVLRTAGLTPEDAVGLVLAMSHAGFAALSFATLRLMGLKRSDAAVYCLLMSLMAAMVFMFPVPESFGPGAVSIMAVMFVAALADRREGLPGWAFQLASLAAVSMTTTNWLAAAGLLLVFLGWRATLAHGALTLALALALWGVERAIFPASDHFLNLLRPSEVDYLMNPAALGVTEKLTAFFFHSAVMPELETIYGYRLSVQAATPGQGGWLPATAALAWTALLGLGAWSAWRLLVPRGRVAEDAGTQSGMRRAVMVLLLAIAGQMLVTILFGIESFLYTAHFAPLLALLAALSGLTQARYPALALATVVAVLGGLNNLQKLELAAAEVTTRLEHENRFGALVKQVVAPEDAIICGVRALAGSGEATVRRVRDGGPVWLTGDAACAFSDKGQLFWRPGFKIWHEDWSLGQVKAAADLGARYFVTHYSHGVKESADMLDQLSSTYHTVSRNEDWAIFDLTRTPPGVSGAVTRP